MDFLRFFNPLHLYRKRHRLPEMLAKRRAIQAAAREQQSNLRQEIERQQQVEQLRDRHKGERCVIIGMGPSLKAEDLDRLKGTPTFACNKIFLAFENTTWRPDYYTVSDVLVAENNREEVSSLKLTKIFPEWVRKELPDAKDILWLPVSQTSNWELGKPPGFSRDLAHGIEPGGCTVLYDQLQMAYHMGFAEAVLIGVDFSFSGMKATGEKCEQGDVLVGQGEVNHFHKDYRKVGETWTIPKLDAQILAFKAAREAFERDDRKVVNASRTTKLDVFPCKDFDELFPTGADS